MSLIRTCSKVRVAESPIKSFTADIDAVMAAELLSKYNSNNRPMSKAKVALYANEMLRGKWELNGEPLIFGVNEEGDEILISGQHRLAAIVKAAAEYENNKDTYPNATLTIHVVIVHGVAIETADTVDQGSPRNHKDVLFRDEDIKGMMPETYAAKPSSRAKWCQCLAGAARLVWLRSGGATVSSAPKFLTSEMLDFIHNDHPYLAEFVTFVLNAADGKENSGLRMSLPYIAALSYVAACDADDDYDAVVLEDRKDAICLFLTQVASGTGFTTGDPAHAITQYWNKLTSEPGSKDRDLEWVAPFVKCLTALVEKKPCRPSDLKLSKKEAENYRTAPCLLPGWDTARFNLTGEVLADEALRTEITAAEAEEAKKKKAAAKEAAKKEKEAAKAAATAAKEAVKSAKGFNAEAPAMPPATSVGRFTKRKPATPTSAS